jgi:tetratricopeptide (TPR) repeat protein
MLDAGSWDLQEGLLAEARADMEADPGSADALIWVGRRLGYLGRYDEAIATFTQGMEQHPADARFLRHRGHRLISVRDLDGAVADLARAWEMVQGTEDEVEPDGLPNERGIPTSTLHSNIRYHLGLAHYLLGDFEGSGAAYQADVDASANPDMRVASTYWLYLSLRRLGRDDEAAALLAGLPDDLDIIENQAYYDLLMLFKGSLSETDLLGEGEGVTLNGTTVAYGVGAWHLVEGRTDRAMEIFQEIREGTAQWPAFGYIAAEAELARGR